MKSHTLENVVTGQIFMAIENIHSKCVEIDNSIKVFKGQKKADLKGDGGRDKRKQEGNSTTSPSSDNDMMSLAVANEKLKYILDSLMDFRDILKKEKLKV